MEIWCLRAGAPLARSKGARVKPLRSTRVASPTACSIPTGSSTTTRPAVQGPCPGTAQDQVRDVTVVLAHPMVADLIVVRGCGFTCQVAVSADGSTFGAWRQAPQAAGTAGTFADQVPAQRVVAVRVQTATGGFFTALRQVSVWGPLAP